MSSFRSNFWRSVVLPVVLTVALLLPTLHLHPVFEYDHDGHARQQTVIHADFFSVSPYEHDRFDEDVALSDSFPSDFSQSTLSALLTRSVDSLLTGLEKSPEFLLVDLAVGHTQLVPFTHILKRDHPSPVQQVLLAPSAPRSPPRLA